MKKYTMYAYMNKNNNIKGITDVKEYAKELKRQGVKVVKIDNEISDRISDIPMNKEIVELYGVVMSAEEEEYVLDEYRSQMEIFKNAIDNYAELINYIKDQNILKELEEFSFYLHNVSDGFTDYSDDICYSIQMKKMLSSILEDLRGME